MVTLTKQEAMERCAKAYEKHKHLKRAAMEVGIPWQTVFGRYLTPHRRISRVKYPGLRHADELVKSAQHEAAGLPDGRWVVARPVGYSSPWHRLYCTWLVFTGKADALIYKGQ